MTAHDTHPTPLPDALTRPINLPPSTQELPIPNARLDQALDRTHTTRADLEDAAADLRAALARLEAKLDQAAARRAAQRPTQGPRPQDTNRPPRGAQTGTQRPTGDPFAATFTHLNDTTNGLTSARRCELGAEVTRLRAELRDRSEACARLADERAELTRRVTRLRAMLDEATCLPAIRGHRRAGQIRAEAGLR